MDSSKATLLQHSMRCDLPADISEAAAEACWQMLVEAKPKLRVLSDHSHIRRCMPAVQCLISRQYFLGPLPQ